LNDTGVNRSVDINLIFLISEKSSLSPSFLSFRTFGQQQMSLCGVRVTNILTLLSSFMCGIMLFKLLALIFFTLQILPWNNCHLRLIQCHVPSCSILNATQGYGINEKPLKCQSCWSSLGNVPEVLKITQDLCTASCTP
jgi:hypothetical protein